LSYIFSQFCLTRCKIAGAADAAAREAGQIGDNLALEAAGELAAEEVHDLRGTEAQRAVAEQARVQLTQAVRALEHHVGGVLGLRRDPVVLAAVQHIVQLRHDLPGVSVQQPRPVQVGEPIGQALRSRQVADADEDVVDLGVLDAAGRELARQPLVAVEVDLDLQREPGLHPNVQQTQIAVHEVVVQVQALALGGLHVGLPGGEAQRERAARLQGREDTHQTIVDAVTLGDLARGIFLAHLGAQVLERPAVLASHGQCMRLDALGVGQQERLDAGTVDLVRLQQLRHRPPRHDWQIAAEQHAVEARQHAVDAVLVLVDERLHASLRSPHRGGRSSMPGSTRRHLGCGRRPR
jgi:hypothetical protein